MKTNPINSINYKGIPIADISVKEKAGYYKLFSITRKDKNFLQDMYKTIDLQKLMPNMSKDDDIIWNEIIKKAVILSQVSGYKSILEAYNNKPCGILTYKELPEMYHLSYVATFPTEKNKRVPLGGQILFHELYNRFTQSDKKKIELSAIREAPFSPIATYLKLGFFMRGGDEHCEYMNIDKNCAMLIFEKQKDFINYNLPENKKNINLHDELKLNFIV